MDERTDPPKARWAWDAPARVLEEPPKPDEGPDADPAEVEAFRQLIELMDDAQKMQVARLSGEAGRAGLSLNLRQKASTRRLTVGQAIYNAVTAFDDHDDELRAALGVVMGEEIQPTVALGAVFGAMTVDEARRFSALCLALGDGVAVRYENGQPLIIDETSAFGPQAA